MHSPVPSSYLIVPMPNTSVDHILRSLSFEIVQINPKLRTYQLFKKVHEFEPYLHITNSKLRSAIAKIRTSAHSLEIERGRYAKPKTPVEK